MYILFPRSLFISLDPLFFRIHGMTRKQINQHKNSQWFDDGFVIHIGLWRRKNYYFTAQIECQNPFKRGQSSTHYSFYANRNAFAFLFLSPFFVVFSPFHFHQHIVWTEHWHILSGFFWHNHWIMCSRFSMSLDPLKY